MPGVILPTTARKPWVCLYDFLPDGAKKPTHTLWVNAKGEYRVALGCKAPGKRGVQSWPIGVVRYGEDAFEMQLVLPSGEVETIEAPSRQALLMAALARMAGRQVVGAAPAAP